MRTPSSPGGGRRKPSWRLWTVGLSAVVLAVTGTTVALQSASAEQASTASTSTTSSASAASSDSSDSSVSASSTVTTTAAACSRTKSKTAKTKVTSVSLPYKVKGYGGEGDTEVIPMAVAAAPNGQSWLAWVGTSGKVYLGKLGCNDKLTGKVTSFTGIDLQDITADANGGAILITKKGSCGTGPLCGGTSSPCNTMHLIRFDNSGKTVWSKQVTNLSSTKKGYSNGARFVWWYQHHGRIATGGGKYAAYFGTAITVKNGSCVDIHQGDRLQVVTSKGKAVASESTDFSCSHAWNSRVVYDPAKKKFITVCATDNECRIAQANPYRTVVASKCDGTLFGGDLILAKTGYWTAWSQGGKAKISRFTTGKANKTVNSVAATQHPHLVKYGSNRMVLSWGSGSKIKAKIMNRSTGATIGSTLTLNAKDHDYMSFKEYKDGSVAYAAAGATTKSIKIARVMPMT
ncbi:hypothetical protein KIH74_26785 [Kineosporia sp. J2-2]|uniref:Uncharacterized protein n=1 Tax=Kineosporia corallincola TaxID=2835133 RepID=A0ABS5TNA7_9ACTN|nr:hypothetical protein [Kineosporia corallincola]MBT0772578.1 hypothetical protein [Kineosporia corallincola]